ncbi:IclR family transcriptional regulator [Comamonas odontotermitis]|uniref:IclR family transcriptional regulator n=1 Tax=Comamonas odontotermitis TaxID=379895 RepID=UPI001CC5EAD5|nr:IclR family transcriptional regulator [Comamonas odontotermitis]UBB15375.1 IclR family transcriptional regulator [Comamonas odontotermitis]
MSSEAQSPPDIETPDSSSGVAVLDRAFALLGAFEPTDERLSLTELSRRTGLYKSTVLRLLAALEHGGFMRKLDDGQYAIGPQPMRLAAIYQRSFRVDSIIEPLLAELSGKLGETASFYVRAGARRLVVSRVEPARAVRVSIRIGEEFDVSRGASGKVLLAFTEAKPSGDLIRARLWATSYGERDPETASASVPVFGALGELKGALTVSGPLARLGQPAQMEIAVAELLEMGRRATLEFGGSPGRYVQALARVAGLDCP